LVSEVLYFLETRQRKAAGFGRNRLTRSWRGLCAVNSGGASGEDDPAQAACLGDQQAAGGTGLISWRKALQKPIQEGMESLQAIRDGMRWTQSTQPELAWLLDDKKATEARTNGAKSYSRYRRAVAAATPAPATGMMTRSHKPAG